MDQAILIKILWLYSTFETYNLTLSIFPGKIPETRKILSLILCATVAQPGVFNLLGSRVNLYLSYNPAGRSHCGMRSLIPQPLHCFTYVTAHSPTFPPLYLRHSSFYCPTVVSPTPQALHLCQRSFSNPSVALPTSHVILKPFRCFTYVTGTSPGEPPMHRWIKKTVCGGLTCNSKLLSLEVATVWDSC